MQPEDHVDPGSDHSGEDAHRGGLPPPGSLAFNLALFVLLGIGGYFLWAEHRVHLGNLLIWGLLLACPLMHVFMHGRHGGHRGHGHSGERSPPNPPKEP